jgi:hypothetical protein
MPATEQLEELNHNPRGFRAAPSPARRGDMEAPSHCAYNQTRECFLGLEVEVADLAYSTLAEKLHSLALKSGEGLWIAPFRGLPAADLQAPLDLIYLDEQGCVLDTVESFPTFNVSASCPSPASVLALPAHSIYSSQTQAGDQLVLCVAEEMGVRLELLAGGKSTVTVQSAVLLREEPLWSGGPGTVEFEAPAPKARAKDQLHEMTLVKPTAKNTRAPKNWLERWWSPDPRKAPREQSPGLAAYFWNGAAPEAHGIRDISSTGLYLVTEERWYPGTLVLMTLQRTDCGEEMAERSIQVLSRAVRWGQDGVGLQFILADSKEARKGSTPIMESAERKELEKFLEQLKKAI